MKKFIVADGGYVGLDTETNDIFTLESQREAISRIFRAEEPMTVVVKRGDKDYEINAKKDDLIVVFYDSSYEFPAIVVKSKDWVKNLKEYEVRQQKQKEEWAVLKKNSVCDCDSCENCACAGC
jgi:hypothetical protein